MKAVNSVLIMHGAFLFQLHDILETGEYGDNYINCLVKKFE